MDALTLMRVLRRWWLVTLGLLILLAVALAGLMRYTPAEYESSGVGLVIRQSEAAVDDSGRRDNPFAQIDDRLAVTATLLVTVVNSPAVQQQLVADGLQGDVEVTNEGTSYNPEGPFVTVTATAPDPQQAAEDVRLVLARANVELANQQDALSSDLVERLDLLTVVPPPEGQLTRAGLLRSVGLAGVAGLVLILVMVVALDRIWAGFWLRVRISRRATARRQARVLNSIPKRAPEARPLSSTGG